MHVRRLLVVSLVAVGIGCAASGAPIQALPGTTPAPGFEGDNGAADAGPLSASSACAKSVTKAQQKPLDVYLMLDQSASMADPVLGGTKWDAVVRALITYADLPSSAGVSMGVQYFGLENPAPPKKCQGPQDCPTGIPCGPTFECEDSSLGIGGDYCTAAVYANPEVEIAPLPGASPALKTSLGTHSPTTWTPTSAALQGAIDHARAWATAHPDHVTVTILATDGVPTECDTSLPNIDAIAAAAAAGTPRILTYVIGIGNALAALDGIAAAGGTGAAFLASNLDMNHDFLLALAKIRGSALGCEYAVPPAEPGKAVDLGQVNILYSPGGAAPVVMPKVLDKAHCPSGIDAWYYDDATPQRIVLCDSSCQKVTLDPTGEVDVLVGCATVIK
jgi:hypothetical protein